MDSELQKIEKEIVAELDGKLVQTDAIHAQELNALKTIKLPVDEFSWKGRVSMGYVLDLVDGDTISVALYDRNHADYSNSKLVQVHVRLFGIDTPEQRPRLDDPNRIQIKEMAADSHKHLYDLLDLHDRSFESRIFTLLFLEHDKYGRPLAILCKDSVVSMKQAWQISFNKKMIDDGFALPYNGGTKWSFETAQRHYNSKNSRNIVNIDSWQVDSPAAGLLNHEEVPEKSFWNRFLNKFRKSK